MKYKKYAVFDNGKPADCHHCNVNKFWAKSTFNSFEEAESYLLNWLGGYSPGVGVIKENTPFHYSGYGDYVEIRVLD